MAKLPANVYAYNQVLGAMHRRGAAEVTHTDLTITGRFDQGHVGSDAAFAWRALSTKYPVSGTYAVFPTRSADGCTLTFSFQEAEPGVVVS